MAQLQGSDIVKNFGGVRALNAVSFHVGKGEIVALIGPNGAGKTTLLNTICGLKPDSGTLHFDGKSIVGLRSDQICTMGIARTFQFTRPFVNLSAMDNVASGWFFGRGGRSAGGLREAREEGRRILQLLGLQHRAQTLARDLLLAERRRLDMARALATAPDLLLLDEVMAGLNPTEVQDMMRVVDTIRKDWGVTILMVEHIMKAVMGLSDRVIVLNYGSKIAEGPPEEVARNEEVITAYLGERIV
ncbi:MAG: ABC transporter ATP-binding protein [Chloroflexi bacterium]|nr:ABC transporter ATP-binding protein [Chloroflexota bacterium]